MPDLYANKLRGIQHIARQQTNYATFNNLLHPH